MGTRTRTVYDELAKADVGRSRNVVISKCSKGGYTVAQQLVFQEPGCEAVSLFFKGALHIADVKGLYNLRDSINLAIFAVENGKDEVKSGKVSADIWDD